MELGRRWNTQNSSKPNQVTLYTTLADPESGPVPPGGARAIIGPHAGYRYCGANAAYAYRQIDPSRVRRVFVLGPSHHYRSHFAMQTVGIV